MILSSRFDQSVHSYEKGQALACAQLNAELHRNGVLLYPIPPKRVTTEANIPEVLWLGLEFVDPKSYCAEESGV